jgi:hypothetical protein
MARDAMVGAIYRDSEAFTKGDGMSETATRSGIVVGVDGWSSSASNGIASRGAAPSARARRLWR